MKRLTQFSLSPELTMNHFVTQTNCKLTATDNAVLRYNISLAPDVRNKLKKYYRLFAKSDVFVQRIVDEHDWKDFLFLEGQPYEIAYRECGRDQLEQLATPVDLFLSVRVALDSNVRICLVTPVTPELVARTEGLNKIAWLQPDDSPAFG